VYTQREVVLSQFASDSDSESSRGGSSSGAGGSGVGISRSDLKISHSFSNRKDRRVFVPIYLIEYSYKGDPYRFWVNGNTAKHTGTRPYSPGKLASLSFTGFSAAVGLISSRFG
jgi:hypothetical protein